MNIDLNDKRILIFLLVIAILLSVNIVLMMQGKNGNDSSGMYKAFAEKTHSSMQKIKTDSANLIGTVAEKPDMNSEQKEQMAILRAFYNSMNADIAWISEKENTVYWQMIATQNPITANGLMRQEMAIMVVGNYIFALNNEAIKDDAVALLNRQETVEEARAALSWITVGDLLNDDVAQSLISGTQLKKEDLLTETKTLMVEFLEIKKKALQEAVPGTDAEYAAALNLLETGYLFEVNNGLSEMPSQ